MTTTDTPTAPTLPEDVPASIRQAKSDLRTLIGDPAAAYERTMEILRPLIDEIADLHARGETAWPEVEYADLAAGRLTDADRDAIRRRGCVVIRGHFPHDQALAWDASLEEYVESNGFFDAYRGPGDDFFGTMSASRPAIYPIYWSPAQMEARQSERMAAVQAFLNRLWAHESQGKQWFDPDQDTLYPDRIRRRPPGTDSDGLGAHCDSGSLERWLLPAYRDVYAPFFTGQPEAYDAWDAAHRPEVNEYAGGSTMCSVFRTFQGWTALSDMANTEGVLHTVPIPEAIGAVLLRPLLDDVADDELCGAAARMVLPILEQWHPELYRALVPIPDLKAGDSVWWHADMIHAVAPVTDQKGWGNVMYIPAAPACPKNLVAARRAYDDFLAGRSPQDFPAEDYETDWAGRFSASELNEIGRRGFGQPA